MSEPMSERSERRQLTRSVCVSHVRTDVDDLVEGIIRMMNQEHTVGPVNLGNPCEFTIKQLAELAIKVGRARNDRTRHLGPRTLVGSTANATHPPWACDNLRCR